MHALTVVRLALGHRRARRSVVLHRARSRRDATGQGVATPSSRGSLACQLGVTVAGASRERFQLLAIGKDPEDSTVVRPTLVLSFLLVACASPADNEGPPYTSMRERLAAEPTYFTLAPTLDIGTLEARRWSNRDGWVSGSAPVALSGGTVEFQLNASGQLVLRQLGFGVDAIELPATLVGQTVTLRDVRVVLAAAPPVDVTWISDGEATAQLSITLSLSWSIAFDEQVGVPLGEQVLAPMPMTIALAGDGEHVETTLELHGRGTLWSWADLLELTGVDLIIAAS